MPLSLKATLRSAAASTGFEVQRSNVYTSARLRRQLLFSLAHIDLIVDIGANAGQFAHECRACGYRGQIISFEPSLAAHSRLLQSAASDSLWTIADRMALGATTGEIEINIAANSFSSSILPMLETHLAAAPQSTYIQKESVPLHRLDDVLDHSSFTGRKILLKLDVQGYESEVLAGAPRILSQTSAVQLEMSLLPLYQGEVLMPEMIAQMREQGFHLWDLQPSFRDQSSGRLLQVDGLFMRQI